MIKDKIMGRKELRLRLHDLFISIAILSSTILYFIISFQLDILYKITSLFILVILLMLTYKSFKIGKELKKYD